jgi:hypothetical protein
MKIALLALLTFTAAALAEDKHFYGAWWATRIDRSVVPQKHAGELLLTFHDDGTFAMRRAINTTNGFVYRGTWIQRAEKITFATTNEAPFARFSGSMNDAAVTGIWRDSSDSGKFQATRDEDAP